MCFQLDSLVYDILHFGWVVCRFVLLMSGWQVFDTGWFQVRRVVRKHLFLRHHMAYVLYFMAMGIKLDRRYITKLRGIWSFIRWWWHRIVFEIG